MEGWRSMHLHTPLQVLPNLLNWRREDLWHEADLFTPLPPPAPPSIPSPPSPPLPPATPPAPPTAPSPPFFDPSSPLVSYEAGPHMVHCRTVHLPLGALLIWRTMCGTGMRPRARAAPEGRTRAPTRTRRTATHSAPPTPCTFSQ